jgi:hypothetical protein
VAGTVTVSGPGLHRDIAVGTDGSDSVTLLPGRYTVVGTLDVLCQMK